MEDQIKLENLALEIKDLKYMIENHEHKGTDFSKDLLSAGMILLKSGSFTTTFVLAVNGNEDLVYKLIMVCTATVAPTIDLRFNSDSGANYNQVQYVMGRPAGADAVLHNNASGVTSIPLFYLSRKSYIIEAIINAKSGVVRLVSVKASSYDSYNATENILTEGIWTNTTNNITAINIILSQTVTGRYSLYKI